MNSLKRQRSLMTKYAPFAYDAHSISITLEMNATQLLEHFDRLAEAPDAVSHVH